MSSLDRLIAVPRVLEQHHVDVGAPAERAHALLRHIDLRRSALVRMLLSVYGLPLRLVGQMPRLQDLSLDGLTRRYGLRVLVDDATTFAAGTDAFGASGDLSVGFELRCTPLGERAARVTAELRVGGDDEAAWKRFERTSRLLAPFARIVMRNVLDLVVNDFGAATASQAAQPLRQRA